MRLARHAQLRPYPLPPARRQSLPLRLRPESSWRATTCGANRWMCARPPCALLIKTGPGLRWNEHIEGDGETIFRHACKLGLEASCPSVRTRLIVRAALPIGLR